MYVFNPADISIVSSIPAHTPEWENENPYSQLERVGLTHLQDSSILLWFAETKVILTHQGRVYLVDSKKHPLQGGFSTYLGECPQDAIYASLEEVTLEWNDTGEPAYAFHLILETEEGITTSILFS